MTEGNLSTYNKLPQWFHFEQSDHMTKPIEVNVTGEIPKWISGSLYRNGAGLYRIGPNAWNHLFDGYAVLQRWTFNEGKVTYQASILDSPSYKQSAKHKKLVGNGFGGSFPDPCETIFHRLFNKFIPTPPKSTDNPNINLMDFGDRLFALTEATFISEVKPDSLSVKDKTDLKDYLPLHLSTAHPHKLKDGTMIFFGTNMNYKNAYNFIEIPPPADPSENPFAAAKIVATVPSRWKMNISYTHSFGLTENYFVHLEQPLTANLPLVFFQKPLGKRFADVLTVHEGQSMDIMLVDRATGKRHPITYEAPEGMAFHFINSYEEADHVVCDICFKPKGALAVYHAYLHIMAEDLKKRESDNEPSYFARFVLPLSIEGAEAGKNLVTLPNTTATATLREGSKTVVSVTPEIIKDGMTADFPGINYSYNGMKYRYCYTCTALATINRNLAKFDLVEKRVLTYDVGDDHQVGEPVFLARPGATREDDGVVLSTMIAFNSRVQSYLVILDAITFTEIARASLPSEMKMTFTFHGMFCDKIL